MSTTNFIIRPALLNELPEVLELCAEVFADEAVLSWVIPDPEVRRDYIRRLFTDALRHTVEAGELVLALTSDGQAIAASRWHEVDPNRSTASVSAAPNESDQSDPIIRRLHAADTATSKRQPAIPHLYLSSMATHTDLRGEGAGTAMLHFGIDRAKDKNLPVYLEASTPQNQCLYLRNGFRDFGEPIALPEDGPILQPMWLSTW